MKLILITMTLACATAAFAQTNALYENNFEKCEPGKLPEELMVLNGDFTVKREGTNNFLELPGAPLDSYGVLFGPTEKEDVCVDARVFGTAKGRRAPAFGVGLGGVAGWKLQVAPAKNALELLKDLQVKVSQPFEWRSGEWTHLRLQVCKLKDGEWKVSGKAWPRSEPEPKAWMISASEKEEPIAGKASVLGSPFSGTPIGFDDLVVTKAIGD